MIARRCNPPGRSRLAAAAAILLMGAALAPLTANAAREQSADNAFVDAVAALDSPDWKARLCAAEMLRGPGVVNDEIESALHWPNLSAEQQHHLLAILQERILSRDAGAIGIQMDRALMSANIIVVDHLFSNMPAERVLKRGDRITHINGREIHSISAFREELRQFGPGDAVTVVVERPHVPEDQVVRNDDDDAAAPPALHDPGNAEGVDDNGADQDDDPDGLHGGDPVPPDLRHGNIPRLFPRDQVEVLSFDVELGPASNLGKDHMQTVWQERMRDLAAVRSAYEPPSIELRAPDWRSRVDTHPVIVELLRQVNMYERASASERRAFAETWKRIDEELYMRYTESGLSVEERRLRRDVLSRFRDLIPPEAMADW